MILIHLFQIIKLFSYSFLLKIVFNYHLRVKKIVTK